MLLSFVRDASKVGKGPLKSLLRLRPFCFGDILLAILPEKFRHLDTPAGTIARGANRPAGHDDVNGV